MKQIEKAPGSVDLLELRQLLTGLRDNPELDVLFRFRLAGQKWYQHFARVLSLTETGVTLVDVSSGKVVIIPHLLDIAQFEVEARFHGYQPHFHYMVRPLTVP